MVNVIKDDTQIKKLILTECRKNYKNIILQNSHILYLKRIEEIWKSTISERLVSARVSELVSELVSE